MRASRKCNRETRWGRISVGDSRGNVDLDERRSMLAATWGEMRGIQGDAAGATVTGCEAPDNG